MRILERCLGVLPGMVVVSLVVLALATPLDGLGAEPADDALPKVDAGRVVRLADVASRHVDARNVDVWLPPECAGEKRCPVVYLQDGQMLFDEARTWNHQSWHIDRALTRLADAHAIPPTIAVAIWNDGRYRWSEYFPQKILERVAEPARSAFLASMLQARPQSDAYLKFVVGELKPLIDARFATLPDRAHTFIAGSSMGAVIAVYAMSEYPQVFGGAAGLSVHWAGKLEPNVEIPLATFEYLQAHLAPPQGHRLYMDHGTATIDAWYAPYQLFVDEIARAAGYTEKNFQTRVFEGAAHEEVAWANRVAIPLEFLLAP
jgi:enterochelin esterase-like enzyme